LGKVNEISQQPCDILLCVMTLSRTLAPALLLLLLLPSSFAATQAACAFTTFSAPSGYKLSEVDGVSDDGTVVGQLENKTTLALVAFTRSASGTFTRYSAPKSSITWLVGRNGSGINVGYYLDNANIPHVHGFRLQGTQFSAVNYPFAVSTWALGINQLGAVVGAFSKSSGIKGFRLANGTYTVIAYPGAQTTFAESINNNGDVVGFYSSSPVNHGFLWQNGKFTTIDYASSTYGTILTGVNKAGLIVGNRIGADTAFGFIYQNGVFKNIVYSGAIFTMAGGINNNGLIAGQIFFTGGSSRGYTAMCK
jgi:probable HAF family extracellular repeat protein